MDISDSTCLKKKTYALFEMPGERNAGAEKNLGDWTVELWEPEVSGEHFTSPDPGEILFLKGGHLHSFDVRQARFVGGKKCEEPLGLVSIWARTGVNLAPDQLLTRVCEIQGSADKASLNSLTNNRVYVCKNQKYRRL